MSFHVLLVEDELDFANTLAERLALRNIQADVVEGAADAVSKAKSNDYDVVILDLVLWQGRGFDVLKEIKEHRPDVPVILLSGRGSEKDFEEGKKRGAYDYLIKPVQIEELIEKMNQATRTKTQ
ncbi:MAG: response regulator [bacterium]